MWSQVSVKTPPATLPVLVADLKARLRIEGDDENTLLASLLREAAAMVDGPAGIGVALLAQTWTLAPPRFAAEILLPGWPVTGVAEVRYLDAAGDWQVVDPAVYRLAATPEPARLALNPGQSWPSVPTGPGRIQIDYTLGAATRADLDASLVTALCLMAGHYYENREAAAPGRGMAEIPLGASAILARHRRGSVA